MTETANGSIDGNVDPGFEPVRDAFAANFAERDEVGAACSVYVDGRAVVDLWGGVADLDTGRPYDADSLQLVFSTTKGMTAACICLLAQAGEIDIDAPVAHYWPGFERTPKAAMPVTWLLTHQAGLPCLDIELSLDDVLAWDPVIDALERQAPLWEPGTAHGYHAFTFGHLAGEVVRRVTGQTLGQFFDREIARPLGLDLWIGLPREQEPRVAPLVASRAPAQHPASDSLLARAMLVGPGRAFDPDDVWNRPEVLRAEVPAGNGVANARSLARFYAALIGRLDGSSRAPLLDAEHLGVATTPHASGTDRVLGVESRFGLGFARSSPSAPALGGPAGFGHPGAGGSVGFADPVHRIGFGYVMNRLGDAATPGPSRAERLSRAVYQALGIDIP